MDKDFVLLQVVINSYQPMLLATMVTTPAIYTARSGNLGWSAMMETRIRQIVLVRAVADTTQAAQDKEWPASFMANGTMARKLKWELIENAPMSAIKSARRCFKMCRSLIMPVIILPNIPGSPPRLLSTFLSIGNTSQASISFLGTRFRCHLTGCSNAPPAHVCSNMAPTMSVAPE